MKGTVTIGNKEVGMVANAASLYIYKQVFHEDFLQKLRAAEPETDIFQKMGYIMAKQAETDNLAELMKLTEAGFLDWLSQFDAMDVIYATEDISNIYMSQKATTSVAKKKGG
jgi:hypothetical protein